MLLVGARLVLDIEPGRRRPLLNTLLPVFSAWTLEHHHATRYNLEPTASPLQ